MDLGVWEVIEIAHDTTGRSWGRRDSAPHFESRSERFKAMTVVSRRLLLDKLLAFLSDLSMFMRGKYP